MSSNIKPKSVRKDLREGVDSLLDSFERWRKSHRNAGNTDEVTIFAGSTGQLLGGRFDRLGGGTVAVLLDVGVDTPIPGDLGGGLDVNVGDDWGHDGAATLESHTAVCILAFPKGAQVDIAGALAALVQRTLPTSNLALDPIPASRS